MPNSPYAHDTISELEVRPTSLSSKEIRREWSQEIKEQALFSARTTSQTYLEMVKQRLAEVAAGTLTPQVAESRLRDTLDKLGYTAQEGFPEDKGKVPAAIPKSTADLSSSRRIELILDTNIKRARSIGQMASNSNPHALLSTPAWKLTRTGARKKPRSDWKQRWKEAGDACAWKGALKNRLVALKTSPIWQKLGEGAGGFDDALGTPYPPFAFGSGMAWIGVDRGDWEKLCEREGVPNGMDEVLQVARQLRAAEKERARIEESGDVKVVEQPVKTPREILTGMVEPEPTKLMHEPDNPTPEQARAIRALNETTENIYWCVKKINSLYLPSIDKMKTAENAAAVLSVENKFTDALTQMLKYHNAASENLRKVQDAKHPISAEGMRVFAERMNRFTVASGRYEALALELFAACKKAYSDLVKKSDE